MVTSAGIKFKVKTPRRDPLFNDEKYTGSEPQWDHDAALMMQDDEFDHNLRRSFYYYNYFFSQKQMQKTIVKWLHSTQISPERLKVFERADLRKMSMTACSLVKAATVGMPMKTKHLAFVMEQINAVIDADLASPNKIVSPTDLTAKKAATPTIQDRLAEKTSETIGEIEGEVDTVFMGASTFKAYDFLTARNVPQSQVGKIREQFQRQNDELATAMAGQDAQLKEAFAFLLRDKKALKRVSEFYAKLLSDMEAYTQAKKVAKKVRVTKAPSKEKLIAKVKFMKESKELKIVSVSPADIVGATEVWVYQTKYRKLGHYVAEAHQTLSIKGTTILNYSEMKSVAKTLRKPADQLKEFSKAGKVALRTFLKDIKATETRLNGRLNDEILILKVG